MDINGGFENAAIDPGSWKVLFPVLPDSTQINGWVVGGNGIDYIGTLWQPSEGSRSIDLSAYAAGTINTTLNTIPGTTYRLLFDMAGNPFGGPDEKEKALSVCIDDRCQKFAFDTDGKNAENMGWQTNSLDFTATASATRLAFVSLTPSGNGPALDNVRIAVVGKTNDNGPNPNLDLTGVWSCDDTGTYYIRQVGNTVWWDGDEDNPNLNWANVAYGTISDNIVTLYYADVPEADGSGYGTLVLDIISNDELKAREKPSSFGGSRWVRSSNKKQSEPINEGSNNKGPLNPWDDPSVRQLIDEWLRQQDNCAKKADPGYYVDAWSRLQGSNLITGISNAGPPDGNWDSNYHYIWVKNECKGYYPYRVQDYVKLRQSGSTFDGLAKCKGWYDGC